MVYIAAPYKKFPITYIWGFFCLINNFYNQIKQKFENVL